MRLLLDEHLPPAVADRLNDLGHDVVVVARRSDLRSAPDSVVLAAAIGEDRVLVTADLGDFTALAGRLAVTGERHAGIVLVAPRTFPTTRTGIGRLVRAIDALAAQTGDSGMRDRVVWLRPPTSGADRRSEG